jgi:hypothetical protein
MALPFFQEPGRVNRAHLGPVGVAPVQLGLDQRGDVDPVDGHVHELAGDLDVSHLDAAQHGPAQVRALEPGAG